MQKFLFEGSFNPFTIGHHSVFKLARELFGNDNVFIGIAQNEQKTHCSKEFLKWTVNPISKNILTLPENTLTADYCLENGISCLIRSMRNTADFNYEVELASWNRELGVETVFIPAEAGLEKISSSSVRMLAKCGKDISGYLPEFVNHRWLSRPKRIIVTGFMGAGKSSYIKACFGAKRNCVDMDDVAKKCLSAETSAGIRAQIMRGELCLDDFATAGRALCDEILSMPYGLVIEASALGTYSQFRENTVRELYNDSVVIDVERFDGARCKPTDEAFMKAALDVQKAPLVVDFTVNSSAQSFEEIEEISAEATGLLCVD
jgi:pantetheine-phosphate adenylyltransferase